MNRNDVILGIVAAVLVGFSLVVAILLPRRDVAFPGRHLRLLLVVSGLLIVGMLTAVEVLGEGHHFAVEGGSGGSPTGEAPTASTPTTTAETPTETGGGGPAGNPDAGKEVFTAAAQPSCSGCHTLSAAGASGQVGPNLDAVLKGKSADFIRQSIVDPDAEIAPGYQAGIMPSVYGDQLSETQLADLVAFLVQSTKG
ncbi:MAG: cytochrome c [Gaiellaceae bacterium]